MSDLPGQASWGETLLSAKELAAALGISRRWVYEQVEQNGMPAYKLGRKLAFELSAVRRWLKARRIGDWPLESCEGLSDRAEIQSTMKDLQNG